MLAQRITPATGAETPLPVDIVRMREICYRTVDDDSDTEFAGVLNEAIDDLETLTGLQIRAGEFTARFPVSERASAAFQVTTGMLPPHLEKYEPLKLPGVNCQLVSLKAGQATVAHGETHSDHAGNLYVEPPDDGWERFREPETVIVATFTAGGNVPKGVQKAIGLRALWHLNDQEEDEDRARRQVAMYAYRQPDL